LKLNEDLDALKNQKEKIASDLLDSETLNKKLKKENLLLKNSSAFALDVNYQYQERISSRSNIQVKDNNNIGKALYNNYDNNEEKIKTRIKIKENADDDNKELNNDFNYISENKQDEGKNADVKENKLQNLSNLFIQKPKVILLKLK